jgi:hypothetical protein
MIHRNDERSDPPSLSRHNRQEIQHLTPQRAQRTSPSRNNMDRCTLSIAHAGSGGYGKFLGFFSNLFSQLNIKNLDI